MKTKSFEVQTPICRQSGVIRIQKLTEIIIITSDPSTGGPAHRSPFVGIAIAFPVLVVVRLFGTGAFEVLVRVVIVFAAHVQVGQPRRFLADVAQLQHHRRYLLLFHLSFVVFVIVVLTFRLPNNTSN